MGDRRRPSVTEDPAQEHECSACGKLKPQTREYFHTRGHGSNVLVNICKVCQGERDAVSKAGRRHGASITLVNPRPVVFDDLGTSASVGWYGDVEYFPITPLIALTKYTSEVGLLDAIQNDPLTSDLTRKFLLNGLRGAPLWCLPWSHFNAFCIKFGSEQTLPQQQRAQQVLEKVFGKTAASNRSAAAPLLTDDAPAIDPDLITQVGSGFVAILQSIVDSAVARRMGAVPQQIAETHETLQGATIIEKQVKTPVYIDRKVNGRAYVFIDTSARDADNLDLIRISAGEGMGSVSDILSADRYNGGKGSGKPWVAHMSYETDDRKEAQRKHHRLIERAGGMREPGRIDIYWVSQRILNDFQGFPSYLRAVDVGALSEQAKLFRTPMELL